MGDRVLTTEEAEAEVRERLARNLIGIMAMGPANKMEAAHLADQLDLISAALRGITSVETLRSVQTVLARNI